MARVKHPINESSEDSLFGALTPEQFYAKHGVTHTTEYITNSRGIRLFTQSWRPKNPTIGCVAVVHGFSAESSWLLQLTSVLIASSGFVVCAIDHQGHGFSDGLLYHIPDISLLVDDCITFFSDFRAKNAPNLPSFIYAESLGGAVSLYIVLRQKGVWDGLVLHGAMCGISGKFKPSWPLEHLLKIAAKVVPTWHVVPTRRRIQDLSFKVEWKRRLAVKSPRRVEVGPRASTAVELLRACEELQGKFEEVDVPLMIVHGEDDVVCDPECVKSLYGRAASKDKTLKLYPGMWHQLAGEPEDSVDLVFGDVIHFLQTRASNASRVGATLPVTI